MNNAKKVKLSGVLKVKPHVRVAYFHNLFVNKLWSCWEVRLLCAPEISYRTSKFAFSTSTQIWANWIVQRQPIVNLVTYRWTHRQLQLYCVAVLRPQGRQRFNFRLLIFSSVDEPTSTLDLCRSGSGSAAASD